MADLRRCIGSAKFGIEGHDAPPEDFPAQPSQKDGLGRMCKTHWREYTTALRKAALARKAADGGVATEEPRTPDPAAVAARKGVGGRKAKEARAAKPEPIRVKAPRPPRNARGTTSAPEPGDFEPVAVSIEPEELILAG